MEKEYEGLLTEEDMRDVSTARIEEEVVEEAAWAQFVAAGVAAGVAAFPGRAY